jgi:hypothetical protein
MRMIITLLFLSFTLLSQAQRPGGHNHHDHHGHYADVPVPMSSIEFSQAKSHMDRESFDSGKMRLAKGIINGNYLLSQQVKVLVEEFTFKDNQEELALYAYPKTYDQNKYYMVYNAFTFDSSKDKVSKWVSTQPINDYQGRSYYGPSPISDADFAQGLNHLRSESFDSGKMRLAKQLIDGNYIYADQVAVLVKEFDFKGNEEEIAKYAYPKTYDQKNYYLIYDAFTFHSSKDELERWLDGQPIKDHARPPNNNHNHGGGYNNSNHGNNHGGGYNNSNHGNNHGGGYNNSNHGNNHGGGYNNSNPNLGNNNGTRPNLNSNNNTDTRPNNGNNSNNNNNNNNWNDDRPTVNITLGKNPNNNATNNNATNNNQGSNVQAMSARDFDTMKARITDFSSDNDRINKAKEYLPTNFLLAEQVKEIMGLFVFEDVRLDFSKAAYAKTYDPQNYDVVKSVLVNPSSKQDLQAYMDNY